MAIPSGNKSNFSNIVLPSCILQLVVTKYYNNFSGSGV
jgi:hypothetical protein